MKKLFLQSGKLMIGEFPEEPSKPGPMSHQEFFTEYYEDDLPRYRTDVESAKASAVEVVNGEDCFHKINDWLTPLPGGGLGRQLQKGELCDLPKGWTVEIEETLESSAASLSDGTGYAKVTPTIIARLIPASENAQGAHYGDTCGICGGPCVVGSKGLYCPRCQPNKALNEVGIVATGIAEAEQPEALAFLNEDDWTVPGSGEKPEKKLTFCDKCGELIVRGTEHECYYVPVPSEKDVERARMILKANGLYLDQIVGKVYLSKLSSRRNAVPPPSQAESESREVWNEMLDYCTSHMVNDIRLLEYLMEHYILTRKTKP